MRDISAVNMEGEPIVFQHEDLGDTVAPFFAPALPKDWKVLTDRFVTSKGESLLQVQASLGKKQRDADRVAWLEGCDVDATKVEW